jgi:hypothetical protein
MGRSVYFSQKFKPEQELYEDIIIESIKRYGFDCFYMPRALTSLDTILNEDTESRFDAAFNIEMYIENVDGYEGDGVLMSKFGLEIRQQVRLVVSRRRWNTSVGVWNKGYSNLRPSEGDLIYVPLVKGLFEIKYVDLETPFYQLQNLPVYKMTCELFEYRGEDLNTGVQEIDTVQNIASTAASYRSTFAYLQGSPKFELNEYVNLSYVSGATGQAKITDLRLSTIDPAYPLLVQLSDLRFTDGKVHPIATGVSIRGATTGAQATLGHVVTLTDGDNDLSDGDFSMQNTKLETKGNTILDFTETNPFGDPNDA